MRILFLNHNVAWHGAFLRAYHWGRHLVEKGHEVTLLTIDESSRWSFQVKQSEGVRLVKSPDLLSGRLRTGWDPWDTIRRCCYVLRKRYDLVHSVDTRPVSILPAIALKKIQRVKLVIDWGDWWGRGGTIKERGNGMAERLFEPVETFFEEAFRTQADGSVVLTSALGQRLVGLGVSADTIVRIPHGADSKRVMPRDKDLARGEIGLPAGVPIIGYVGLLFPSDADFLMKAFELLKASNNDIRLLVIGNSNIEVPGHLLRTANVIKTGTLSYEKLQQYIACCDATLLPLRDSVANVGRWPSKVCDYMAAGKPVIATRIGDIAEVITETQCGVLTEDSPEDFASKTLALLNSPNQLMNMGINARRAAESRLDWRTLTEELEAFYLRLMSV